ncbi:MAG: hypothetical protein AB1611_00795 [bacterium]
MESGRKKVFKMAWIMAVLVLVSIGFTGRIEAGCCTGEASSPLATGDDTGSIQSAQTGPCPILDRELLGKAEPDECYNGIGKPYPPGPPCSEGVPKVNQTYVWGMTMSGDDIWFASSANVTCMAMASSSLTDLTPRERSNSVCEYGESQFCPPLLPPQGDWRPPKIYVYHTRTKTLVEKTPECTALDSRIKTTMGIRSAGALGNVVIFGGPCLPTGGAGINLFAFRADTGDYLGSTTLAAYADIRKWRVVNDVLYTAVRDTAGGGSVLRWRGNLIDPFIFEVVGKLDSEGVELAEHEGRLFVTTWPEVIVPPPALAGLYMSPPIPPGGLLSIHANSWTKVWQANDYEPDLFMAGTYGGGPLASFKGYLYWGTMHVPGVAQSLHFTVFGEPEDPNQRAQAVTGTTRRTSLFRGRNFGTSAQEIKLLYGEEKLWKYTPDLSDPGTYGTWEEVANNMGGAKPLFGSSGLGQPGNYYTWSMAVFQDQLYVGTMDAGGRRSSGSQNSSGGDLFRFCDADTPAFCESWDGLGNTNNIGFRNMVATEDALYVGTASMANLVPDPDKPHGGWELIRLTPKSPVPDVDPLPEVIAECGITLAPPTATEYCTGRKITATTSDTLSYTKPGVYTVTWTYGPASNHAIQTQQVIIQDSQPPVPLVDPLPAVTGKGKVTLVPPAATDSCAGKITATTTDPTIYSVPGTYTVTWTYADGHGHSITQTQQVTVDLAVDIKPGKCPNQLSMTSIAPFSVVVLGSSGFDVTSIDFASIRLGREGVSGKVIPERRSYADLSTLPSDGGDPYDCPDLRRDGYKDLIMDFNAQEVIRVLQLKEVREEMIPLVLSGSLKAEHGGSPVRGQDYVSVNFPWHHISRGPSARTTGWQERGGSILPDSLLRLLQRRETPSFPYWDPFRQ